MKAESDGVMLARCPRVGRWSRIPCVEVISHSGSHWSISDSVYPTNHSQSHMTQHRLFLSSNGALVQQWDMSLGYSPVDIFVWQRSLMCPPAPSVCSIMIHFLGLTHCHDFHSRLHFVNWTLSPSSDESLLNWAQSIQLIHVYGSLINVSEPKLNLRFDILTAMIKKQFYHLVGCDLRLACLPDYSVLKTEAAHFFQMPENFCQTTQCHILEDCNIN